MFFTRENLNAFAVWITRFTLGIIVYLALEIRNDVKEFGKIIPVQQEQIKALQSDNERLKNKVFASLWFPAKKPDEITFQNLLIK